MSARYPYPGTPGAIGRPHWQCPPVTPEASHAATGATTGTCAVCIARPGACHCTACTPYHLGASIEEVALDLDRDVRVARRVLYEHGTIVERRKTGSRLARTAALLLLLALPLSPALARGHGPVLGEPARQSPSLRALRREQAERAFLSNPLAAVAGWRYLQVRDLRAGGLRYIPGRQTLGDGNVVIDTPGRIQDDPPTLTTTDGASWAAWLLVGPDGSARLEWRPRRQP